MTVTNPRILQPRPPSDPLRSQTRQEFIAAAGNLCRRLGLPRSVGQIYGLAFFSSRPLSLDEIAEDLGISKASSSTGARQLTAWGALRQVWVPGDRRDFFEIAADPARLFGEFYREFLKPRIDVSQKRLASMVEAVQREGAAGTMTAEESEVVKERLTRLREFPLRLQAAVPAIDEILYLLR